MADCLVLLSLTVRFLTCDESTGLINEVDIGLVAGLANLRLADLAIFYSCSKGGGYWKWESVVPYTLRLVRP